MLQEGVGDVEDVVGKLGIAARSIGQLLAELVVGDLGKQPLRSLLYRHESGDQLRHREHVCAAPLDAGHARHVLQHLAVRPILAAAHNRHAADAEFGELRESSLVGQHVDGDERHPVPGEELLHAQAAGAAGLPIGLDGGLGGRLGHGVSP